MYTKNGEGFSLTYLYMIALEKKSEELPLCCTNHIHIHSFDIPKPPLLQRNFICCKLFSHFLYAVSNAGFKK